MSTVMLTILKTLLTKLLTEKFVGALIISLLEYAASKTTNTIDDEFVKKAKECLDE